MRSPTRYILHLVLGPALAAHRARVELLQLLLDALEREHVLVEHPFEQRGEERRAVQVAGAARPRHARPERLERGERALVSRHHPALAHYALELHELVPRLTRGRVGGHVDVLPAVVEERAAVAASEPARGLVVEVERLHDRSRRFLRERVQVDPQQHLAPQPRRPVVEARELLDHPSLEQQHPRHAVGGRVLGLGRDGGEKTISRVSIPVTPPPVRGALPR
jgi:hypothetical protein